MCAFCASDICRGNVAQVKTLRRERAKWKNSLGALVFGKLVSVPFSVGMSCLKRTMPMRLTDGVRKKMAEACGPSALCPREIHRADEASERKESGTIRYVKAEAPTPLEIRHASEAR